MTSFVFSSFVVDIIAEFDNNANTVVKDATIEKLVKNRFFTSMTNQIIDLSKDSSIVILVVLLQNKKGERNSSILVSHQIKKMGAKVPI